MTDLPRAAARSAPARNPLPEYTVSELGAAIRRTLEGNFERVRVRGEISGLKRAASGHIYLSLKDTEAVLDAVCWKATAQRLSVRPEDGLEVVATGRLTAYPGRSKYQLLVDAIEIAGAGALLKLLEERRQRLAAEGLFEEARDADGHSGPFKRGLQERDYGGAERGDRESQGSPLVEREEVGRHGSAAGSQ